MYQDFKRNKLVIHSTYIFASVAGTEFKDDQDVFVSNQAGTGNYNKNIKMH